MCQISSGLDSHSSKISSPECLKHFPCEYFYHAKMKAGALCHYGNAETSTAKLFLKPGGGRVQVSFFLGI